MPKPRETMTTEELLLKAFETEKHAQELLKTLNRPRFFRDITIPVVIYTLLEGAILAFRAFS